MAGDGKASAPGPRRGARGRRTFKISPPRTRGNGHTPPPIFPLFPVSRVRGKVTGGLLNFEYPPSRIRLFFYGFHPRPPYFRQSWEALPQMSAPLWFSLIIQRRQRRPPGRSSHSSANSTEVRRHHAEQPGQPSARRPCRFFFRELRTLPQIPHKSNATGSNSPLEFRGYVGFSTHVRRATVAATGRNLGNLGNLGAGPARPAPQHPREFRDFREFRKKSGQPAKPAPSCAGGEIQHAARLRSIGPRPREPGS